MTVINPNSISGITSITLPSGGDNVLTIHTNDGVERFRIDSSGNVKVGTAATISPDGDLFVTGVCTATTLSGAASGLTGALPAISGANLTNLTAGNLTGALPAISGANLTGIAATDNVRTGILDVAGIATFRDNVNVPNLNGGQLAGRRNIIINGAMMIAQRGTSQTGVDANGYATVDRFSATQSGTDAYIEQHQVDVASGTTPYTNGFRKAFQVKNGNQTSGAGAADYIRIKTVLEGQDIANSGWNYKSTSSFVTLSFWVKSSVAQNFYGFIRSTDGTMQQYPFSTGSLSADTWTKVTKTIPGNSNLAFDNNTGGAFELWIHQYSGTNETASDVAENAWAAYDGTAKMPDNTSTWYTTDDATFELTGVQLEVGSQATPFEHRSVNEELALCQRYYQVCVEGNNQFVCFGDFFVGSQCDGGVKLPVEMRTTPSLDVNTGSDYYIIYTNATQSHIDGNFTIFKAHTRAVLWYATPDASRTAGHANRWITASSSAKIAFDAEI